jgi:hypothetical protein
VKRKRSILVTNSSSLGMTSQQQLYSLNRSLPHGSLMDWQVSSRVRLGCTTWVGLEERLENIGASLEGAGSMKRKISAVVQTRCFLGKGRILRTK